MKHVKMLLLTFFLIAWSANLASAVELQVIVVGHGYVEGEKFSCVNSCTKSYEKGTVVSVKAIAFPDSQFAGWKLNGAPHEGAITLEEDTVLSAVFERLSDPMLEDGMTVYWYDGNGGRAYAHIAPDEMLVELKEPEEWGMATEKEYQKAVKKVLQSFHPQAEISIGSRTLLYLEGPEQLKEEQFFKTLIAIQNFPYVHWVSPVFYTTLGVSWTQLDIGRAIFVYYPTNYTESEIAAVENEYGLERREPIEVDKSTLYVLKNPLEAIEIANRVYESGLVKLATPLINSNASAQ